MSARLLNSLVLVCLLVTTSCASMLSGTSENFHLKSSVPGTKIFLNHEELGTDSATVTIPKKDLKDVVLVAKKEGCTTTTTEIETRFDSTTLLGLFLDLGIITILVVDWGLNGAVREAKRTNYVLNPVCEGETPAALPTAPVPAAGAPAA